MAIQVEINKVVTFTDNSTGKDASATYTWDFGDGSVPSTTNPATHMYTSIGLYNVSHSVKNSCNTTPATCSSQQIEVVPVGQTGGGGGGNAIIYLGLAAAAIMMIVKK